MLTESGIDLLNQLLTYDPEKRITARAALQHAWFAEAPAPQQPEVPRDSGSVDASAPRRHLRCAACMPLRVGSQGRCAGSTVTATRCPASESSYAL